jgi:hypothetical protein
LAATRDEVTICRWWRRGPAAPILLATGRSFDVLDVPEYAAAEALRRLELTGYRLGPLAQTGNGRVLIWMASGARLLAELVDRRPWPYGDLGLYCRSVGEYVIAPPSCGTRWLEPPVPYAYRILPRCSDILGAVVQACQNRGGLRDISNARRRIPRRPE